MIKFFKMNQILKLFLFAFLLNACAKAKEEIKVTPPSFLTNDVIKNLITKDLFTKKYAIFKDKNDNDVKVSITISTATDDLKHSTGHEYKRERTTVEYINEERKINTGISIFSDLSTFDALTPAYSLFIENVVNDHALDLGSMIGLAYDKDKKKLVVTLLPKSKENEVDIIRGKTFKNVFKNASAEDYYKNEMGFNTEFGIVSLNDFDRNLYVFDRFE